MGLLCHNPRLEQRRGRRGSKLRGVGVHRREAAREWVRARNRGRPFGELRHAPHEGVGHPRTCSSHDGLREHIPRCELLRQIPRHTVVELVDSRALAELGVQLRNNGVCLQAPGGWRRLEVARLYAVAPRDVAARLSPHLLWARRRNVDLVRGRKGTRRRQEQLLRRRLRAGSPSRPSARGKLHDTLHNGTDTAADRCGRKQPFREVLLWVVDAKRNCVLEQFGGGFLRSFDAGFPGNTPDAGQRPRGIYAGTLQGPHKSGYRKEFRKANTGP